jgi:hypothetical protein
MKPWLALVLLWLCPLAARESPKSLAETYAAAIDDVNAKHARSPGKTTEAELAKNLPVAARNAFTALLAVKSGDELLDALCMAADAAADLDFAKDFEDARARLESLAPDRAKIVGRLVSRPRFIVRGTGGLDAKYLEHFADVLDAILGAYDDVFGFAEWSKVPGKKLRVLVHLEPKIERPPHFAPEFPYHSQIDFPVDDASALKSPTSDGKFLFYGLCHELGHVIAMWGDTKNEEDHHAWAHYCGVTIVEHLANDAKSKKLLDDLNDVKWRSLEKERDGAKKTKPSLAENVGVMALVIALHDTVGPKTIGAAINALDAQDKRLRVNKVRYYTFTELRDALVKLAANDKQKKAIRELLP